MKSFGGFLRAHTWVVFLAHQGFIFVTAAGFLYTVGRLTGRAVHLGREPLGAWGAAALALLSLALVALTCALYEWVRGPDSRPLGVKPSPRRLFEMAAGAGAGFALAAWPWGLALAEVVGATAAPNWVAVALMLATVSVLFFLFKRSHDSTENRPRAEGRRA